MPCMGQFVAILDCMEKDLFMKYEFLLFDADNTILDFDDAEVNALTKALESHGYPADKHVVDTYRKNNVYMWEQLEKGHADKPTVRIRRFEMTFAELGWLIDGVTLEDIAEEYEQRLHDGFAVVAHAEEVLIRLQSQGHKLYLVSNGFLSVQVARMKGSGMGKYFPVRFISEQVGYSKPQKEFFDYAFARIPDFDKQCALIIGDSLTSDIKGGINAGIDTCWFNPGHKSCRPDVVPTYEIDDLRQLFEIV